MPFCVPLYGYSVDNVIDCNRAMRFSIDGWVAIILDIARCGCPGNAMQAVDMDVMRSNASTRGSVDILRRADAKAAGSRVMCAPVASAAYSRLRDTAMRSIGEINQLNTTNANQTINSIAPALSRLSLVDDG